MDEHIGSPPLSPAPGGGGDPRHRLARLRREYSAAYPGLDPGVWYPARSVAEYFLAWLLRHPGSATGGQARVLEADHFEFRGGVPRDAPWVAGASPAERQG